MVHAHAFAAGIAPMNEAYLRLRTILDAFSLLYPEAWRQVDDLRARRKELGDWPDWCFLPLAGAYAIVSKGTTLQSIDQARHVGILGALAAWRVTQGIYRFDPTVFDALWDTPVTGDIPTEVLFHLPEWCVYIPTPDRRWRGDPLHGFFAHLEHDANDRRTELRFVLDITRSQGDDLEVLPLHLGRLEPCDSPSQPAPSCPISGQMTPDGNSPAVSRVRKNLTFCSVPPMTPLAGNGGTGTIFLVQCDELDEVSGVAAHERRTKPVAGFPGPTWHDRLVHEVVYSVGRLRPPPIPEWSDGAGRRGEERNFRLPGPRRKALDSGLG
jgi:hypothetical protein